VVNVTAIDAPGNSSTGSVTVTVVDTAPPVIAVPKDLLVVADASGRATVTLPAATASDVADPNPQVTAEQSSWFFPLGTTPVNVTATDASGNTSTGQFTVTVVDGTGGIAIIPVITQVDVTSAKGVHDAAGRWRARQHGAQCGPRGAGIPAPRGSARVTTAVRVLTTSCGQASARSTCPSREHRSPSRCPLSRSGRR
jgi:hypothetical protein